MCVGGAERQNVGDNTMELRVPVPEFGGWWESGRVGEKVGEWVRQCIVEWESVRESDTL